MENGKVPAKKWFCSLNWEKRTSNAKKIASTGAHTVALVLMDFRSDWFFVFTSWLLSARDGLGCFRIRICTVLCRL